MFSRLGQKYKFYGVQVPFYGFLLNQVEGFHIINDKIVEFEFWLEYWRIKYGIHEAD